MDNAKAVGLLHDLYAINYERARAYENASFLNHMFDLDARGHFALLSNQSRQNIFAVKQHIEHLTKKPILSPLPQGQLYKTWTELNISFAMVDKITLTENLLKTEAVMLDIYEKALDGNIALNETIRRTLREQQVGFRRSEEIMNQIRASLAKVPGRPSPGRL